MYLQYHIFQLLTLLAIAIAAYAIKSQVLELHVQLREIYWFFFEVFTVETLSLLKLVASLDPLDPLELNTIFAIESGESIPSLDSLELSLILETEISSFFLPSFSFFLLPSMWSSEVL